MDEILILLVETISFCIHSNKSIFFFVVFCCPSQVSARVERQQGEAVRLEQEMLAEGRAQELEVADITSSYQRLEKVVVAHLHGLQRVLETTGSAGGAGGATTVAEFASPSDVDVDMNYSPNVGFRTNNMSGINVV